MSSFSRQEWRYGLAAVSLLAIAAGGAIVRSSSIEGPVSVVEKEVAAIRGLPFKHPIPVRKLSVAQAREFIVREVAKAPEIEHYWAVVRMLGLYRGPDLESPAEIFGRVASIGAGAYDADSGTLLQFGDLDEQDQRLLFAHELDHGLQDQYFDLNHYLLDKARRRGSNEDELLARQAVVEGEAIYVDSIYQRRQLKDSRPMREQLADVVAAQREWNAANWEQALQNPALTANMRARVQRAIDARNHLPRFMFECFVDSYLEGMAFIHSLHEKGWPEVEKLYREYPPESTEQILHPEKWVAHESPVAIAWPAFDSVPMFKDWQLLHENVLGERRWRLVFQEQGFESEAEAMAAGWGGDRFAVFRNRRDGRFLMLIFSSWDTPAHSAEFAAAYRRLLVAKYLHAPTPTRVLLQGNEVLIVEGATEESADAFMEFNQSAILTGQ